ncbi:MAG: response regulator [Candidatus Eutrophobiaceae bacterium]
MLVQTHELPHMPAEQKKRIVLVDDNCYVHEQFQRIISNMELELSCFHLAMDAIDYLDDHNAEMLFIDELLPDLDGYNLLNQLRSRAHLQRAFAVMMAPITYAQSRAIGRELGVVEFIDKPTPSNEIQTIIGQYINRQPY